MVERGREDAAVGGDDARLLGELAQAAGLDRLVAFELAARDGEGAAGFGDAAADEDAAVGAAHDDADAGAGGGG